jgi:hypothetical protein
MLKDNLSQFWLQIQENLFPWLQEEIGVLNEINNNSSVYWKYCR